MKLNDDQLMVGSLYWGNLLKTKGAGIDSGVSAIERMLAVSRNETTIDDLKVRTFTMSLYDKLNGCDDCHVLMVDYAPQGLLLEVMKEMGLENADILPFKTTMTFKGGAVQVQHGDGAGFVDVKLN